MKVYALTDTGRVRPINEDAYYLPEAGEHFCAIADGMGGHNAGEVASAMAISAFAEVMREGGTAVGKLAHHAVKTANDRIFKHSMDSDQLSGMGTTFIGLCINHHELYLAHVGDSRAYRIRTGSIEQLTHDHTLVAEMVACGMITQEEARIHPKRNYITRALGTSEDVEVDLLHKHLEEKDIYFLCTDGLSNHVCEEELLSITLSELAWDEKLKQLVDRALENGSSDNVTAMYVVLGEEEA